MSKLTQCQRDLLALAHSPIKRPSEIHIVKIEHSRSGVTTLATIAAAESRLNPRDRG